MGKVAIIADIHAGVPGRLTHNAWSCRVVREYCKQAGIKVVFVLGDLWHDREAIGIEVLNTMTDFFIETARSFDQQWVVFPGNHDMFLRHSWDYNSLLPLQKYLTVIKEPKLVVVEHRRFWILPFIQYEKAYMKVVRAIDKKVEEGDILLTHIGVRGASLNTCFLHKDWSVVDFTYTKFKRVYTGHFHSRQSLDERVFYPGSLIPFKFDEGDVPHGFYVLDLPTLEHRFVNIWKAGAKLLPHEKIVPPQFCTFLDNLLEEKTIEDIKHNSIRVCLQRDYTEHELNVIRERLLHMGAIKVSWTNMLRKIERTERQAMVIQPPQNFFAMWMNQDAKGLEGLDLSLVNRVNNDVVQEGDELYSLEETEV